jgi:hypothetical protein
MIFNKQGVPLGEVLTNAALARTEAQTRQRNGWPELVERNNEGEPIYRILKTKLGDAYRVFRAIGRDEGRGNFQLRAIRSRSGVGRPPGTPMTAGRSFEPYGRGPRKCA